MGGVKNEPSKHPLFIMPEAILLNLHITPLYDGGKKRDKQTSVTVYVGSNLEVVLLSGGSKNFS